MSPAATLCSTMAREARMRLAADDESSTGAPVATSTTSSIESFSPTWTVMARGGYGSLLTRGKVGASHTLRDPRPIIRPEWVSGGSRHE